MNIKQALKKIAMNSKKEIVVNTDKPFVNRVVTRVSMNFRFTALARDILNALAETKGLSKTSVLEQMLREEAKREKIVVKQPKKGASK